MSNRRRPGLRALDVEPLESRALLAPLGGMSVVPAVDAGMPASAAVEPLEKTVIASVVEYQDVGYFLVRDHPRLVRYDIAGEAWLAPIPLADDLGSASALLVDDAELYVAYGAAVYRYDLDGTNQAHVLTAASPVVALHGDGNLLFVNHSQGSQARLVSVDKTTRAVLDAYSDAYSSMHSSSLAAGLNRIVGRDTPAGSGDAAYIDYLDDGTFVDGGSSPFYENHLSATRAWLFANESKLIDDSGTVYATSNLAKLNKLPMKVRDVAFYGGDVPIVLHDAQLTAYTNTLLATGSYALGYDADEIFVNDAHVIVFAADVTSADGFQVGLVPLAALNPPQPTGAVNPAGLAYTPDDVELAADGSVLLYSKQYQSIFRWLPEAERYGPTIPLSSTAEYVAYSPTTNTIYAAYAPGLVHQISANENGPGERWFTRLPAGPQGLATAGSYVFAADRSGSTTFRTFTPDGTPIEAVSGAFASADYVWSEANQKMYFLSGLPAAGDVRWQEINAEGKSYPSEPAGGLGRAHDSPLPPSFGFKQPLRVSPDGRIVVTGDGSIFHAISLVPRGKSVSNNLLDAAWLGDSLYTVRRVSGDAQLEQWDAESFVLRRSLRLNEAPAALRAIGDDRLLAITLDEAGLPRFALLNRNLEPLGLVDVSGETSVHVTGKHYNPTTGRTSFYVSLTNHSERVLESPRVRFVDLPSELATLLNPDGVGRDGVPYLNIYGRGAVAHVAPGETSSSRFAIVATPSGLPAGFTPRVASRLALPGLLVLRGEDAVSESGTTTSLGVRLNARPAADVVVKVESGDAGELAVDEGSLTFTPANWDLPQNVIVRGVDDLLVDGNQRTQVIVSVDAAASDRAFRAAADHFVGIRTIDDETTISSIVAHGGIAYFLVGNSPRVERYDVAAAAWVQPLPLPDRFGPASVLHVDADGLYVVYGQAVYRYGLDGSGEAHVINRNAIQGLHSDEYLLFVNSSSGSVASLASVDKRTNTQIGSYSHSFDGLHASTIGAQANRIFGRDSASNASRLVYVEYRDDGTFVQGSSRSDLGVAAANAKTWTFPDGSRVADDSGTVYAADTLAVPGTLGGPIDDLAFVGQQVPIALRGTTLTAYTSTLLPARSLDLGFAPDEIAVNASHVIAFTADVAAPHGLRVDLVSLDALDPPVPGQPLDPTGVPYTPDNVEIAADGSLLLYSKAHQSIFRFDPASGTYGPTIGLANAAKLFAYSAATNTIYLAYSEAIRQIDLNAAAPVEQPFVTLRSVQGLATAGRYVFASAIDPYPSQRQFTFAPDGTQVDVANHSETSSEFVWNEANQKLYFLRSKVTPVDLLWQEINADGVTYPGEPAGGIGRKLDSPLHSSAGFTHPVRVAPDGSVVVLGSGKIHDATTLARLEASLPHAVIDAAWLGGDLFTLRSDAGAAQVERWSPDYTLALALPLPGTPLRLFSLADECLLAITIDSAGILRFTQLNAKLHTLAAPAAHSAERPGSVAGAARDRLASAVSASKVEVVVRETAPLRDADRSAASNGAKPDRLVAAAEAAARTAAADVALSGSDDLWPDATADVALEPRTLTDVLRRALVARLGN